MTELTEKHGIVTRVYLAKSLKDEIDHRRGLIPRSRYISSILERELLYERGTGNQQSQSRPLPGHSSADPLSLPPTTRCDGGTADDK